MSNGQGSFGGLLTLIVALPLVKVIIKQTQNLADVTKFEEQKPKGGKRNA